jgi:hypothetical protein
MNVVVVRGRLAADPAWFETQAGVRIAGFDLVVETAEGRDIVPVSWADPPALAGELGEGDVVVVRGRVRKRFARSGAGTRPYTDVLAQQVAKASRRASVLKLLNEAADALVTV